MLQLVPAAVPGSPTGRETGKCFSSPSVAQLLQFSTGSLSQWREERWAACHLKGDKSFILTRGNGAQHTLVIFEKAISLATFTKDKVVSWLTKALTIFALVLWVALLTTVAALEAHTWYLIGIGGICMLYSVIAAGAPRAPESFSISQSPVSF